MRTKYVNLAVTTFLFLAASQIGTVQGESAYISDVPFHKQEQGYWCGPAVLQMVLEFWGISQSQTEIAAVVYDADDKVTTMFALKNYTRNLGFNNTAVTGNITQLKTYINEGLPAIVLQKISTTNPYGHYRVVVGYDDRNGVFITNDPLNTQNYNITYHEFAELWNGGSTFTTQNWTFITRPEGVVPVPATTQSPPASPAASSSPSPSPTASATQNPESPEPGFEATATTEVAATPSIPELPSFVVTIAIIAATIVIALFYRRRHLEI